jgi:hypothetical protein
MEQRFSEANNRSVIQEIPSFYRTQRFITTLQELAIGPYPEPDESSHYTATMFPILMVSSGPRIDFPRVSSLPFGFSDQY